MAEPIPLNADKRPEPAAAQGEPPTIEQIAELAPYAEEEDLA